MKTCKERSSKHKAAQLVLKFGKFSFFKENVAVVV